MQASERVIVVQCGVAVPWIVVVPHPTTSAEFARLTSLYSHGVLDAPADPALDRLVADLAHSLAAPMAALVFADLARFGVMAAHGLPRRDMARAGSLLDTVCDERPTLQIDDRLSGRADRFGALDGVEDLRAFLGLRLDASDGEAIGALFIADREPRSFGPRDLHRLEAMRADVAALLDSRRRGRLDPATGALDHDAFLAQTAAVIAASRIGQQPASLIAIDIGSVRTRLDGIGPGLGRLVLQRVSDLGQDAVRSRDSFGRLGESTFALLLTDTDAVGAAVLRQRLTRRLMQGWDALAPMLDGCQLRMGTATWRSGDTATPAALVSAALADSGAPADAAREPRVA